MELAQKLLSALFPSRCIICNKTVISSPNNLCVDMCTSCYGELPFNTNSCRCCALPLLEETSNAGLCGRCIREQPSYDYAHSVFCYEGDVIGLVHQLKFSEKITYARTIGELLLNSYRSAVDDNNNFPDCIMPVPLHDSRLRQRGFNQSTEIARVLSKKLSIPLDQKSVIRQRKTLSQKGLNAVGRKKNIKGAFTLANDFKYKHVLIVDDVVTTGSTVNELAALLKKNRVNRVGVLSIARAPIKN